MTKILFGFKIEFLYSIIPLQSVHQFMHNASELLSSLFVHLLPSHFALEQCLFIFRSFIISCISIRTHTDLTSPPVNHHRGQLFQIQAAPPLPPCILTGLSGGAVQRSRPAGMEDAHQTNICPQTRKPTHTQTFRKLMFCKVHAGSGSQEHQQRWCFLSKVI